LRLFLSHNFWGRFSRKYAMDAGWPEKMVIFSGQPMHHAGLLEKRPQ